MKRISWLSLLVVLVLLSCNFPFQSSRSQETQAARDATALAQAANATVLAQAANSTATAQSANATALAQGAAATAAAQVATATAQAAQATVFAQSAAATAAAQSLNATAMAQAAQATAFSQAATATALAAIPPTPVPPAATRLSFAPGATSTVTEGDLKIGRSVSYVLRALAGQTMLLSVYSPNNDVYVSISGVSTGAILLNMAASQTQFTGGLPATQDYLITLYAPFEKSHYTLQVIIPARITFKSGAISATVQGSLGSNETNFYLARASGGQTMTVKIVSPGNNVLLTIYGLSDGQPLVRYVSGAYEWTGVLPATQDYMIEAVNTSAATAYTIIVTII